MKATFIIELNEKHRNAMDNLVNDFKKAMKEE